MKIYIKIVVAVMAAVLLMACSKESDPDSPKKGSVDSTQLVGKWQVAGTQQYYHYKADGTGTFWDEGDDVHEEDIETQGNGWFDWTLSGTALDLTFYTDMHTAKVPEHYVITTLTSTDFIYYEVLIEGGKQTYTLLRVE